MLNFLPFLTTYLDTYRENNVYHYYDPKTNLLIIRFLYKAQNRG